MKKTSSITIAIAFFFSYCNAQLVPSSCDAPDSIKTKYQDDADRLTVRRTNRTMTTYKDSVLIFKPWSDTVLNALMAVYNATSLPARDTVVKMYDIHSRYEDIKGVSVGADSSLNWMHQLKTGNLVTGNDTIDYLISKYHLHIYDYYGSKYDRYHYVSFISDNNINGSPLIKLFKEVSTVYWAGPAFVQIGDGNNIQDSVHTDFVELIYSYGYGDCLSGCICRTYWTFYVYPDCSVEYVGKEPDWSSVTADFAPDTLVICRDSCIQFADKSITSGPSVKLWSWSFQGGTPSSFIGQHPPEICYNTTGTFSVGLFVDNGQPFQFKNNKWGLITVTGGNDCTNGILHVSSDSYLNLSPNPASSFLSITSHLPINEIELKDLLGRTIYHQAVTGKETTINVSYMPVGIYFVVIKNESSSTVVKKWVKE